jgi:hypothetical protein
MALDLRYAKLPTQISYRDQTVDSGGFYSTRNEGKTWRVETSQEIGQHKMRLVADTTERSRKILESNSLLERQTVSLTDNYRSPNGVTMSNALRFYESTSPNFDRRRMGLTSKLRIQHADKLSTSYGFSFRDSDERQFSANAKSISAGLSHLLYENLTTSISINGIKSSQNSGELKSYGGSLSFSYSRRIPWGTLNIGLGGGEQVSDDQRVAVFSEARDESHTFVGISTQIILENLNIDIDSIGLRNADGLITYVRGIDYDVEIQGRAVVIVRDIFAGISDDETVLVDYRFTANPPAKTGLSTLRSSMSLLLWQKLSLHYSWGSTKQRLIDGTLPLTPIDDSGSKFGAGLVLGWSTTRFEMEDRDSTAIPIRRWYLSQAIQFKTTARLSLTMSASISELELKDTGEVTRNNRVNANFSWRVRPRSMLRVRVFFGNFRSETRDTEEKGLVASYNWPYGSWRSQIRYQLMDVVNEFADETRDRQLIYFQIERSFR